MMSKQNAQKLHFNGINTPATENEPLAAVLPPGQFEPKPIIRAGASYHPVPPRGIESILPEVPLSPSRKNSPAGASAKRHARPQANLAPLVVNHVKCNGQCGCGRSPKDNQQLGSCSSNGEGAHPTFSSISEIMLHLNDEEGAQGGGGSRASGRSSGQFSFHNNHNGNNNNVSKTYRCSNSSSNNNTPSPQCGDAAAQHAALIAPVPSKTFSKERCADRFCDKKQCPWHLRILKYPEVVKWQKDIRTVSLERTPNEGFGFGTKALKAKNAEKDEFFVLVEKVTRNGKAASRGLAVGDMIYSINGKPVNTSEEFNNSDLKKDVLQLRMQVVSPLLILGRKKNKELKPVSPGSKPLPGDSSRGSPSPDLFPEADKQRYERIPLLRPTRSDSKPAVTSHYLPQARIFLCGDRALDFVRCMFGNLVTVSGDSQMPPYHVSMEKLPDGSVRFGNCKAFSCMRQEEEITAMAGEGAGMRRHSPRISPANSCSCINIEVMAILNDNFFRNLCSWMFAPESVFILTFDTRKLSLSNHAEMSRLSALADTILSSGVPVSCENLLLFGMKPPGDDTTLEELRTLFYTSLAASLPEPKIIPVSPTASGNVVVVKPQAVDRAQTELFDLLSLITRRRQVLSFTSEVIDRLIVNPTLIISRPELQELYQTLPERIVQSSDAGYLLGCVEKDLMATGNLMETGNSISCELKEFVIPSKFFEFLARLVRSAERDTGSWDTSSHFPGLLKELDLLELVGKEAPCPPKMVSLMKELNLVFPISHHSRDSGFCEGLSLFMPYFIEERPFHLDSENYQETLTAKCSIPIPTRAFFHLMSDLSFMEQCVLSGIENQAVFRIHLDRTELLVHFDKPNGQVTIFSRRDQRFPGKPKLREFVASSLSRRVPGSVVTVSCSEAPEAPEPAQENGVQAQLPVTADTILRSAAASGDMPNSVINRAEHQGHNSTISNEDNNDDNPALPQGGNNSSSVPAAETSNSPAAVILDQILHLPPEGDMNGQVDEEANWVQLREQAQHHLLNAVFNDLVLIHIPLQALHEHLSVDSKWEVLAGYQGLSLNKVQIYRDMIRRSQYTSGKAFLDKYTSETRCSLRNVLTGLINMASEDTYCFTLAENLWSAAWQNNAAWPPQA